MKRMKKQPQFVPATKEKQAKVEAEERKMFHRVIVPKQKEERNPDIVRKEVVEPEQKEPKEKPIVTENVCPFCFRELASVTGRKIHEKTCPDNPENKQ